MMDSTKKNLQQKIFDLFDEEQPENIELIELKKRHRKEYLQLKHQEYKQKWKKQTIRFSESELAELTEIANKYGHKRAPFLKACIYGYLRETYILMDDSQVRKIELSINQIQNSINESLRYIHLNKNITISDIEEIKVFVHNLEIEVSSTLRNPPNLRNWLKAQIENDENFIPKLQKLLTEFT